MEGKGNRVAPIGRVRRKTFAWAKKRTGPRPKETVPIPKKPEKNAGKGEGEKRRSPS